MPYHLTRSGEGYYVVSPHGHRLSSKPMSHEQAVRQETAVRLTEHRSHQKAGADAVAPDVKKDKEDMEEIKHMLANPHESKEERSRRTYMKKPDASEHAKRLVPKDEEHVHTHHAVHHEHQKEHKMDAEGLLFVPVSRELVHPKQVIPTSDIFAPLPMPTHHLRKTQHYASHQ